MLTALVRECKSATGFWEKSGKTVNLAEKPGFDCVSSDGGTKSGFGLAVMG